jgi:hypothetical protein
MLNKKYILTLLLRTKGEEMKKNEDGRSPVGSGVNSLLGPLPIPP